MKGQKREGIRIQRLRYLVFFC